MRIRAATPEDVDAIADVFLRARERMTYLPELHTEAETRLHVREGLCRRCEVWVAELEDRVVGFLALKDGWVEHLYIHPLAQGFGLGTALLDRAKTLRPDGLSLWVFQRNEGARRFYERNGFELVELTDGSRNEELEPDARYEWKARCG